MRPYVWLFLGAALAHTALVFVVGGFSWVTGAIVGGLVFQDAVSVGLAAPAELDGG